MKYRPINEVLDSIIDHRGLTATKLGGQWQTNGIPVISANNIREGSFVDMDSVKYINKDLFEKWMPTKLEKGDVLLVSEGATFGEVLFLRNRIKATLGQRLFALRCNSDYSGRYLYYYLKSRIGQHQLNSKTTGTSVMGIRQSELLKIMVPNIDIAEQTKFADILGSLDDKIFLCQRMNETLKTIGEVLFKHWFIDFEFPNEKGKPYRSSGGDMVDSELGEIPKGWEVKDNISEICEKINYGYTQSASHEENGPKFLRVMDINKGDWIEWSGVPYCKIDNKVLEKYLLKKGDIVIARMADPGKVSIFETDIKAVFASYLIRIRFSNKKYSYYLYYLMKSKYYQDFILGAATGSVQKSLNAKGLTSGLPILFPDEKVIIKFNELIGVIREKINENIVKNECLTNIRDAILPKLISGEIRVSNIMDRKGES